MIKRLFIAVDPPEEMKEKMEWELLTLKKFFPQNIRFIPKTNWHITLTFLGDQEEEKIPIIEEAISRVTEKFFAPPVYWRRLQFGPTEADPRMIWATGESTGLAELKRKLDNSLKKAGIEFKTGGKFLPHITISRLGDDRFHMPVKPIDGIFNPAGIFLIESTLKRSGAEYQPLSMFVLRGEEPKRQDGEK